MSLVKFNNRSLFPNWSELPSFFDNDFFASSNWNSFPATNIMEDENAFIIKMAVPGLSKEDFQIEVNNNMLTIKSEKENESEESDKNYTRKEYSFRSFSRSFTLPENVQDESIAANYENGELIISIPKKELTVSKAKQIEIG